MIEPLAAVGAPLLWGNILGALFFGGLWFTLGRLPAAKRPFLWLATSFALRGGGALLGFYLVADEWQRLLWCLAGFMLARFVISARIQKAAGSLLTRPLNRPG